MKILNRILFVSISVFFISCKARKENPVITDEVADRAVAYYDSISYEFNLYQPVQQKFIDKLAMAQLKLNDDRDATIDTTELLDLFDTAWANNRTRLDRIQRITEVDTVLNYKAKIITYIKHLNGIYEKEIKDYIYILGNKQVDRFQKYNEHLLPKLAELKNLGETFKALQPEFKNKYNFTTPAN